MTQRIFYDWHNPPKHIRDMCPVSVTLCDRDIQYTLYFARAIRIPVALKESLDTWEFVLLYRYILVPLDSNASFGLLEGPIELDNNRKFQFILDPKEFANLCKIEHFRQSEKINEVGRTLLKTEGPYLHNKYVYKNALKEKILNEKI